MEDILITHSFVDADPIAYLGALGAETKCYVWERFEDGKIVETSKEFPKAADAKEFIELLELSDMHKGWVRRTKVVVGTPAEAQKSCDKAVKEYIDTGKALTKNGSLIFEGYLTPSGVTKCKDIEGLENRYQGNRDPDAKPALLSHCRRYLQMKYPWILMCAKGFEADTHVIAKAEQKGKRGVLQSIDKDLNQCEETNYIDMNPTAKIRKVVYAESLGMLWEHFDAKQKKSIKGNGFLFLCFQAMVGDVSDGYKGLMGFGQMAGYKLLKDLTSKEECVQVMLAFYEKKLLKGTISKDLAGICELVPEKHVYRSWDGGYYALSAIELLQQHFFLAYQERGPKDVFTVGDYL